MSITKKTINNNDYIFVNNFRSNRSGFVHETQLYKDNCLIGTNKIQYYNRTWERYIYQSVMRGVVSTLLHEIETDFQRQYKAEHNIKRLTATKKADIDIEFTENTPEAYLELEKLYEIL